MKRTGDHPIFKIFSIILVVVTILAACYACNLILTSPNIDSHGNITKSSTISKHYDYINSELTRSLDALKVQEQQEIELAAVEEQQAIPPLTGEELIDSYIYQVCELYPNIDPNIVRSIVYYESRYQPDAVNKSSGATGLMQLIPKYHTKRGLELGVEDLSDPYGNILVGVDFLNSNLEQYGDIKLALMLYSMKWSTAFEMYDQGQIGSWTQKVLARAQTLD